MVEPVHTDETTDDAVEVNAPASACYSALEAQADDKVIHRLIEACVVSGARCTVGFGGQCLVVANDGRLADPNDPVFLVVAANTKNYTIYLVRPNIVRAVDYVSGSLLRSWSCDITVLDEHVAACERTGITYGPPREPQESPSSTQ